MKRIAGILLILGLIVGGPVALYASEEAAAEHGGGEGHEQSIWQILGSWVNFAALVGLLYLFFTKTIKVQDRFKDDYHQIQHSIESARQAKEEAERRLAELDRRMASLSDEIIKMKADVAREAEEEKKRILDSAHRDAERLLELAHREIDAEVENARKELRKRVAELAVLQSREIIHKEIGEKDQKQLLNDYIKGFGK